MSDSQRKTAIGVGWTGASGIAYGVRLVDVLLNTGHDVNLVVSSAVAQTAPVELDLTVEGLHPEFIAAVANKLPEVFMAELHSVQTSRFADSKASLRWTSRHMSFIMDVVAQTSDSS